MSTYDLFFSTFVVIELVILAVSLWRLVKFSTTGTEKGALVIGYLLDSNTWFSRFLVYA